MLVARQNVRLRVCHIVDEVCRNDALRLRRRDLRKTAVRAAARIRVVKVAHARVEIGVNDLAARPNLAHVVAVPTYTVVCPALRGGDLRALLVAVVVKPRPKLAVFFRIDYGIGARPRHRVETERLNTALQPKIDDFLDFLAHRFVREIEVGHIVREIAEIIHIGSAGDLAVRARAGFILFVYEYVTLHSLAILGLVSVFRILQRL